ncbi:MAG: hypothetical protein OZ948_16300 [Deltaproteobacteria bacterium]|nr:hypothetical protein [Deltaproteobacteria bacterium]
MPSARLSALAAAALLALPGCITDQGTLAVAATRPVELDLREVDLRNASIRRDVTGSDTRVTSVLFLPTGESPRLETAVEDALLAHGGDVMARAQVRTIDWWFLIGVSTLEVRGDVVDLLGAQSP